MPFARTSPETRLKVAVFCAQDYGGAGLAAYRQHAGLRQIGVDSTLWVLDKRTRDPSVKVLPSRLARTMWQRWRRLAERFPSPSIYRELFTDIDADVDFDPIREIRETNIVHFHWMPGILNHASARRAFEGKPVVWTLHDMNPFTGGCHYAMGCDRYRSECGACPQLGSRKDADLSRELWSAKSSLSRSLNIHGIAPSRWMALRAQESGLFRQFAVDVIPNGIPLDVFAPRSKRAARRTLRLPQDVKFILYGAPSVTNERKGFRFLAEALRHLTADESTKQIVLGVFEPVDRRIERDLPVKLLRLPYIESAAKMAALYNAADVQVLPSIADNLPNTIIEALSCGTPTVAFAVGGIPEIVEHKKTGWLAAPGDAAGIAAGIRWALEKQGPALRRRCRKAAVRKFSQKAQAEAYRGLYRSLVNRRRPLVSAIVSVYNAERFLRGCLDDLERQTIADRLEIVIVNSGSEQNEDVIVREYMARYDNIVYIRTEERETVYGAWNRGIKAARGKYITNANADDRRRKDALEIMARALDERPDVALVYADSLITRGENETYDTAQPVGALRWPVYSRAALFRRCCVGPHPMWRREVHDEHGWFDDSFVTAGDYEFWLRISRTREFLHLNESLGLYLYSPQSVEHADPARAAREALLARTRHRFRGRRKENGMKKTNSRRAKGKIVRSKPTGYPKRAGDFDITEIEDGYTIYDQKGDRVHYLNHTAVFILELSTGKNSPAEIARLLQLAYSLPRYPQKEVNETLANLRAAGLIVYNPVPKKS